MNPYKIDRSSLILIGNKRFNGINISFVETTNINKLSFQNLEPFVKIFYKMLSNTQF